MQGEDALPYQTGSSLTRKLRIKSEYFNRKMYSCFDKARKMEDDHGSIKDPKLSKKHPAYTTYGPIVICAICMKNVVYSRNKILACF